MSGLLYLLDVYEALLGASAVAATSVVRYLLAAGFPLFITQSMWLLHFERFDLADSRSVQGFGSRLGSQYIRVYLCRAYAHPVGPV